jgi:site-specific DNA-cytosine methylase
MARHQRTCVKVGEPVIEDSAPQSRNPKLDLMQVIKREHWRMLTPIECERLQTLPDNYTKGVSNTQRYKALGNGWNVDTVAHLLSGMHPSVSEC